MRLFSTFSTPGSNPSKNVRTDFQQIAIWKLLSFQSLFQSIKIQNFTMIPAL